MKAKRLSDEDLAAAVTEYRRLKASVASDEELAAVTRDAIVAELDARKVKSLVVAGVRVTASRQRKVVSLAKAKAKLSRTLFRRVIRESIDKAAWDEAKKQGAISDEIAEACTDVQDVTPRIYVNDIKQAAA